MQPQHELKKENETESKITNKIKKPLHTKKSEARFPSGTRKKTKQKTKTNIVVGVDLCRCRGGLSWAVEKNNKLNEKYNKK